MKHRREIDGLRAIAVLPVILFHAGFKLFKGGFVGVDIFFVISGFLITSIIIREKASGTFSLANFYERRARRILPAVFLVMLCCLPFAWLWLLPDELKRFSESVSSVILFSSNFFFYKTSGYFDSGIELNPLLHTWSLAVEEQFYLIFPVIFLGVWRFGRRNWVIIFSVTAILGLATAQWASKSLPSFGFYLLPGRFWEILVGSLFAFYAPINERVGGKIRNIFSSMGLLVVLCAIFLFKKSLPYPSVYTVIPVLGTGLILFFATKETFVGRLLGNKFFVGIGLISYSAYLWHQPVFAFARHRSLDEPRSGMMVLLVLGVLAISYFSWKYVETPFRSAHRISRRQIFILASSFSLFFFSWGLVGSLNNGFPARVPPKLLSLLKQLEIPTVDNGFCFYSVESIARIKVGSGGLSCSLGEKSGRIKALLFGDSFAAQYEPFWNLVAGKNSIDVNAVTTNWCYPVLGEAFPGPRGSRAFEQCLLNRKFLSENLSSYDVLIFGGNWPSVLQTGSLMAAVDLIATVASKVNLVIVMPAPPSFDQDPARCFKKATMFAESFDRCQFIGTKNNKITSAANATLENAIKFIPNVLYIDSASIFANRSSPDAFASDPPYNFDAGHLSIYGSERAANDYMESAQYSNFQKRISAIK